MFNMFALVFKTSSDSRLNTDSQTLACEKHHTSSITYTALWADTSQGTQIRADPNMTLKTSASYFITEVNKRGRVSQHLTRGAMTLIHSKATIFTLRRDAVQNPQPKLMMYALQ